MWMIPTLPVISPLIPSDAEMLDVDSLLCEHLSNFSPCHAGSTVTIDDYLCVSRELSELADDTIHLIIGIGILVSVRWYVDSSLDMSFLVFFLASEVDDDGGITMCLYLFSQSVRTDLDCILDGIVFCYGIVLGMEDVYHNTSREER